MQENKLTIPRNYKSPMSIIETEIIIKKIKDYFERALARNLNLIRVSAPLFVKTDSGLNDGLNGVERPVDFIIGDTGDEAQIVQSLAKWKRIALKDYNFEIGKGLYTDMNAIRRDETLDNIHSIYVDQWDWEKVIKQSERNKDKLHEEVNRIFKAFKSTEEFWKSEQEDYQIKLPDKITFVTSEDLLREYPSLSSKDREHAIAKECKAVFIENIGSKLMSGEPHDTRASDYDDWSLNGDILFYFPILDIALELSSMGIRVDKKALLKQLKEKDELYKLDLPYHKMLVNEELPYTIGGGIGQSRICMFFMDRAHIGEVQASIWPRNMLDECKNRKVNIL